MSFPRSALLSVLAIPLVGLGALVTTQGLPRFPHAKHERLFPVCEGCHAGITSGNLTELYPGPADCERCHDGTRNKRVEWRPRLSRGSNIRFSHSEHRTAIERTGEPTPTCQACHAAAGPPSRMNVSGPNPSSCLTCHAHANDVHLSPTAACTTCHVPITRATGVAPERLSGFPRPAWHDSTDFGSTHGKNRATAASCAVCHARESCERCHANAERVPMIAALGRDVRVARLEEGKEPTYPEPASHADGEWSRAHGAVARKATSSCANCHIRGNCEGCHLLPSGAAGMVVQSLPAPTKAALGVSTARMARTVHQADIATEHGKLAATGSLQCALCHSAQTCASCHSAADARAFHGANFVERHAVDVFSSNADCQSCHNTERFCRDCHTQTGVASQSRMNAAFHTGQPMWVLSHGTAARMGMESCASCHRQSDCVRCHSASGGWGINPHGAGFEADARAARNSASCTWCHLTKPGGGR